MNPEKSKDLFRLIPSVDKLLAHETLKELSAVYADEIVKKQVRRALDEVRSEIRNGTATEADCGIDAVTARVKRLIQQRVGSKLTTLINATGVIVHTNLGRSPLARRVTDRITSAAMSYSNLEYNLDAGRRGERNSHLRNIMEEITGAEAALAVNNNAAAVLLALSSLAHGKEVIVSRGELIEIGGSFRIPDVMARSGAILKEVGTTNRTHAKDYRGAINENTGLLLKVHPSNYRIDGFTKEVELEELVEIGKEFGIPTMMDLGSGCLVDLAPYGLPGETTVQETVVAGVDIVTFSGDKLLGGPQAGIVAGKFEYVERLRTNPLARALRMDKLTLAGLEATLEEYVKPEGPAAGIPTLDMIMRTPERLQNDAEQLAEAVRRELGDRADISVVAGVGRVGGGALPLEDLPGPRVAVRPRDVSAGRLEQHLRAGSPPVIVLVHDDAVMVDPRTLLHDQVSRLPGLIGSALTGALNNHSSP